MSIAVLNVGEGDTKLTFDKDDAEQTERTRRIVTDMLQMGYAILVKVGENLETGKAIYRRALRFDAKSDEYIVADVPQGTAEPKAKVKRRRGRTTRVSAPGRPATAVARSAGGMSAAADSIEMQNLEKFDDWAHARNALRQLSSLRDQWAGLPMPLEDADLIVDPKYPLAHVYKKPELVGPPEESLKIRNSFYSHHKRSEIVAYTDGKSRVRAGLIPAFHHFKIDMQTMANSVAWGIEQEARALQLLASMLPHHAFKKYLLTGMFIEQSERSGVYYFFRRLKPTVAASGTTGDMRIIAVLCQHPIAYYSGSWAGAMCPTDDVVAHLSLMRGDEALYWRRCNQHRAHRAEAGL
jgi:hypothetical protein